MKTKKNPFLTFCFLFFTLFYALLLAGCEQFTAVPPDELVFQGDLTVTFGMPQANILRSQGNFLGSAGVLRSIMPSMNGIDHIVINLEPEGGGAPFSTQTVSMNEGARAVFNLKKPAALRITAQAYKNSGDTLPCLTGGQDFTAAQVQSGSVSLPFTSAAEGTGKVELTVSWPAGESITRLKAQIESDFFDYAGTAQTVTTFDTDGANKKTTLTFDNVPAGSGVLAILFERGGAPYTRAGFFYEAVTVWAGFTSGLWADASGVSHNGIHYTSADFGSSAASIGIDIRNVDGTPVTLIPLAGDFYAFDYDTILNPSASTELDILVTMLGGPGESVISAGYNWETGSSKPRRDLSLQTDDSQAVTPVYKAKIYPDLTSPLTQPMVIQIDTMAPDRATTKTYRISITAVASRVYKKSGDDVVKYYQTLNDAINWTPSTGEEFSDNDVVTILRDIEISAPAPVPTTRPASKPLILTAPSGSEKTIKRGAGYDGSLFAIPANTALTLGYAGTGGLIIDGGAVWTGGDGTPAGGAINSVTFDVNASIITVGGTFVMNDGVILQNNYKKGAGGAVFVNSTANFTMQGGEIKNNGSLNRTGAVETLGTFTMSGGKITGNKSGGNDGAIRIDGGAANINGGFIGGNAATANGKGIYLKNSGYLSISGSAVIDQNNDVYLETGREITITGALTPDANPTTPSQYTAKITLENGSPDTVVLQGNAGYTLTQSDVGKFTRAASGSADFAYDRSINGQGKVPVSATPTPTPTPITYNATANGGATASTTKIDFTFSASVTGLMASDITISGSTGAATKDTLTGSGTSWSLAINTTAAGAVTVSINSSGIESTAKNITLYKPITYSATANGSTTTSTTKIDFVFSASVTGLAVGDITISGTGAATMGALTRSGTSWSLEINTTTAGAATVSINKSGIESGAKMVTLYKSLVTYNATANGSSTTWTTKIDFTFSESVSGLAATDIKIDGLYGAATKGALTGSGTSWSLAINTTTVGEAWVVIDKSGIESGAKTINLYNALANPSSPSIAAKFDIDVTANSAAKVTQVFTTLQNYLATNPAETGSGATLKLGDIALGDYIDLASLNVAGYPVDDTTAGYGKIDATDEPITPSPPPFAGYEGRLLRLIVVGINTYSGINGNGNDPHIVFQFQNVPGVRWMNPTDTNVGGYAASEIRKYLVPVSGVGGNFLTGLKAAGVPEDFLWAPARKVWNGFIPGDVGSSSSNAAVDTIEDALFLPTEWEMLGLQSLNFTNASATETAGNQGRFEYYTNNPSRTKYDSRSVRNYWVASPYSGSASSFCFVSGGSSYGFANTSAGVAPAFCVK
ncbi:hypothetical protein FACS1894190_05880 [Spirochaetia bacterium]|nr:hypothetical protein FACS1894190_05880 [Spirochaetia bacterium]